MFLLQRPDVPKSTFGDVDFIISGKKISQGYFSIPFLGGELEH